MIVHTKEENPRELRAHCLTTDLADVIDFAAQNMLSVRYRMTLGKRTIEVADIITNQDPHYAVIGDWIVLDNGIRIVGPAEFEQRYTAEEEPEAA